MDKRDVAPEVPEETPDDEVTEASPEAKEARPEADLNHSRGLARAAGRPWSDWVRLTVAIAVGLALGTAALAAIDVLARILAITFLGITIAAALDPVVDRLSKGPLPRILVVVLILLLVAGFFVLLGFLIVPILIAQVQDLIDNAPGYIDAVQAWVANQAWLQNLLDVQALEQLAPLNTLLSNLSQLQGLLAVPVAIVRVAAEFVFMIFIAIYWLILSDQLSGFIASLFPEERGERVLTVLRRMGTAMGGYLRGVFINAAAVGVFSYVGMLVLGVNYALVLGVVSAGGEVIPVVGPLISGTVIVIVALFQSPELALFALGFVVLMQQLENNLLVPVVMRSQVDISPLLTLLAVTIGGTVGGLLGAIVALPLAAALNAYVKVSLAPAIRRHTGAPPKDV